MTTMAKMIVKMHQKPVGQGGLFYGSLCHSDADNRFRWLYDCGSKDADKLKEKIHEIACECDGKIDALYLSHFHADHIDGIDYLTSKKDGAIEVDDVIVPYLDEFEKIMTLASHNISKINLNSEVIEFIVYPDKFFLRRGFKRIIMIECARSEDDTKVSLTIPDSGELKDSKYDEVRYETKGKLEQVWDPNLSGDKDLDDSDSGIKILKAQNVAIAEIDILNRAIDCDWVFVPHICDISGKEFLDFKSKIEALKRDFEVESAIDIIGKPGWLNKLTKCYTEVWPGGKQNSISMSLYIGPKPRRAYYPSVANCTHYSDKIYIRLNEMIEVCLDKMIEITSDEVIRKVMTPFWLCRIFAKSSHIVSIITSSCGGWLLTGDSELGKEKYRKEFESRYCDYADNVNVLMVPHHGSNNKNSSRELFEFFKNLDVCYVAANSQHYNHPHEDVKRMIPIGTSFHVVNTSDESQLKMIYIVDKDS